MYDEDRELIEVSENEWAALLGGVVVGLTVHPDEADLHPGVLADVWCDAQHRCLRMACIVMEQVDDYLYLVRAASAVMEAPV